MKLAIALSAAVLSLAASASAADACQTVATAGDTPLAVVTQNPGFASIFRTWGFIGDSLSSGEHEYHHPDGSTGYIDLYPYSWGQYMCRAMGATGDNYSQGGETTSGWIEHFWNNPSNNNANIDARKSPKQAYVIALGVNDNTMGMARGDVKTDIDTADFTKNANTFAGNYGGIIQRVKSLQPRAKIFVVTIPRDGYSRPGINDVIRSMASVFPDVYVIDLEKFGPDYSEGSNIRSNYYMGGHLTAAGYQYTAWLMMSYIDWIVRHNMNDFREAAFIGTDFHY